MNFRSLLTTVVFFFSAFPAFAQFGGHYHRQHYRSYSSYGETGKRWLKREYVGLHYASMNLDMSAKFKTRASGSYGTGPAVDTAIYINKKSSLSFGLSSGSFIPIATLTEKQMIAIDWSLGFFWYSFDIGRVSYSPVDELTDKANFLNVVFPIGLVYKSGGEVSLNPENTTLFSIGGGFEPTLILGGYNSAGGGTFKMRPYVMAELGIYFGIATKLRATYYPGTVTMIDDVRDGVSGGYSEGNFSVNAIGSSNFVITLAFLPYSHHWGDN